MLLDGEMQDCNIAETDENFRVAAYDFKVDLVDYPHDAIAAAGAPHGGRIGIGERGHEFVGPGLVVPGEVIGAAVNVAMATPSASSLAVHGAGRCDDADGVAMFECSGLCWIDLHVDVASAEAPATRSVAAIGFLGFSETRWAGGSRSSTAEEDVSDDNRGRHTDEVREQTGGQRMAKLFDLN